MLMKKIVCLLTTLVMCGMLVCPAFAAGTFVPSISYKDGPELLDAIVKDGETEEDVGICLVISSIADAKEKSTDITQDDRDLLLSVYKQLSDGSMKLPLEGEYVIRDLVDLSFTVYCRTNDDHHEEVLKKGVTVTATFDLGVKAHEEIIVMNYYDGKWAEIESVKNNGDGTITGVFEEKCPVVFCVKTDSTITPPQTGDVMGQNLILWVVVMLASFAGIVILLARRRKENAR